MLIGFFLIRFFLLAITNILINILIGVIGYLNLNKKIKYKKKPTRINLIHFSH